MSSSAGAADERGTRTAPEPPRTRTDRFGDPLPDSAIARLGTARWRHGCFTRALAYSPDGKKIAAIGRYGDALTIWDAATGKELGRFPRFSQLQGLPFSPNGKMIAAADNSNCYLCDAATGKEVQRLEGHWGIRGVAFSPDGKQVATGGEDGTVRLWDTATGKEQHRIDCRSGRFCPLTYSPDGKFIALSSRDGVIHLCDPASGNERHRLSVQQRAVANIAFSPDGKRLTTSGDGKFCRWDLATGRPLRTLLAKEIGLEWPFALSPDGALLAWVHIDGTFHLWDVEEGVEKRRWQAGAQTCEAIAFAPDGKTLASATTWGVLRLWDTATGRERHPTDLPHGFVQFVRYSSGGPIVVSISSDCRLLWWDLATQTSRRQFTWTGEGRFPPALSPDGNTLAVVDLIDSKESQWEVRLLDVRTGKMSGKQKGYSGSIAFSPDSRLVAFGGNDHLIHVWDASNGKEIRQINDVPNGGAFLHFSPDSKTLAYGIRSNNRARLALHFWDVAGGKKRMVDIQESYLACLGFSPDGRVVAFVAGSPDKSVVCLWDIASGKELCRHAGHGRGSVALAFSPDGKRVASCLLFHGPKENAVHVWEAATGRLIRRLEGHSSFVSSVDFSPDGLTVASGSWDSTILLWDITGRRPDGRWHVEPLTPRQLKTCWTALAHEDAAKAYDAVWSLAAAPDQAVPFLRKHLPPVSRPDAKTIARLIADLDSGDFTVRQKATDELSQFGDAVTADLERMLNSKPSLEVRRRLQLLLDQSRDWTPQRLRDHRAIQALEHIGTRQAKEVLQSLAAGVPNTLRTEEAKAALRRLSR